MSIISQIPTKDLLEIRSILSEQAPQVLHSISDAEANKLIAIGLEYEAALAEMRAAKRAGKAAAHKSAALRVAQIKSQISKTDVAADRSRNANALASSDATAELELLQ